MYQLPHGIEILVDSTTILRLKDTKDNYLIGDIYSVSRFQSNQGEQVDLDNLESFWQKKFKSFGNTWDLERQNYRFLYDTFLLFTFLFIN